VTGPVVTGALFTQALVTFNTRPAQGLVHYPLILYYSCINTNKGGHPFYYQSLQIIFVLLHPYDVSKTHIMYQGYLDESRDISENFGDSQLKMVSPGLS